MLFKLRNTARRGRSLVPVTFPRIRSRIRPRATTRSFARSMILPLLACSLAGLATNHFVAVLDALALVGIGLAETADLGRGLSDLLLVDAGDRDVAGLRVDRDLDSFRNREADGMRVPELEHDLAALDLGAVADADDVELALEALAHALDVVRHERSHEAMEGAGFPLFVLPLELHDVVLARHGDPGDARRVQAGLRPLDHDGAAGLGHFGALRQRDFLFPDARHGSLLTRPGRGLRRPRRRAPPRHPRAHPSRWRRWPDRVRRGPGGSPLYRDTRACPGARRARCRGSPAPCPST